MSLTKRLSSLTCCLILILGVASGQQGEQKPNEYEGEIQSYEPGNLLTIRKAPRVEVKYDLTKKDSLYTIAPGLQKFTKVHVTERDESGTHHVTVVAKDSKPN